MVLALQGKDGTLNEIRSEKKELEEVRWYIVKSMLEDFPELRERVTEYLLKDRKSGSMQSKRGYC